MKISQKKTYKYCRYTRVRAVYNMWFCLTNKADCVTHILSRNVFTTYDDDNDDLLYLSFIVFYYNRYVIILHCSSGVHIKIYGVRFIILDRL